MSLKNSRKSIQRPLEPNNNNQQTVQDLEADLEKSFITVPFEIFSSFPTNDIRVQVDENVYVAFCKNFCSEDLFLVTVGPKGIRFLLNKPPPKSDATVFVFELHFLETFTREIARKPEMSEFRFSYHKLQNATENYVLISPYAAAIYEDLAKSIKHILKQNHALSGSDASKIMEESGFNRRHRVSLTHAALLKTREVFLPRSKTNDTTNGIPATTILSDDDSMPKSGKSPLEKVKDVSFDSRPKSSSIAPLPKLKKSNPSPDNKSREIHSCGILDDRLENDEEAWTVELVNPGIPVEKIDSLGLLESRTVILSVGRGGIRILPTKKETQRTRFVHSDGDDSDISDDDNNNNNNNNDDTDDNKDGRRHRSKSKSKKRGKSASPKRRKEITNARDIKVFPFSEISEFAKGGSSSELSDKLFWFKHYGHGSEPVTYIIISDGAGSILSEVTERIKQQLAATTDDPEKLLNENRTAVDSDSRKISFGKSHPRFKSPRDRNEKKAKLKSPEKDYEVL